MDSLLVAFTLVLCAALTSPPYEVSEAGWGEFYLTARIFLVDETLPPVEMRHFLRVRLVPCWCSGRQTDRDTASNKQQPYFVSFVAGRETGREGPTSPKARVYRCDGCLQWVSPLSLVAAQFA